MMFYLWLLLVAALPYLAASTIVPFPFFVGNNGFGSSTNISQSCAAALNSTINCDSNLRVLALTDAYISPTSTGNATSLCAPSCNNSLTGYHSNVVAQCGSSPVIYSQLTNTYIGDLFQDYYDLICTQDPGTGQYCVDFLNSGYGSLPPASNWSQLPQSLVCSSCQVSFFETIQRSPFLGYNGDAALKWQAVQNICGLNFTLDVNPVSNLTYSAPPRPVSTAGCASGNTYTVQTGDTCESIAVNKSVAQGTLWAINNLFPDCSAMTIGQSLCLPKPCKLYTLQPNDTCWSIAAANGLSFGSIFGYNPTISPDCSNLNATGSVICISNPEGGYYPPPSGGTNSNAQNQYATAVVPAPGPTPYGTTTQCGSFYQVQVADTCERISLAAGVGVALFEAINPSINANCSNLYTGLWYCAHPLSSWNTTSSGNSSMSSTTLPPPAPTPSGTTASCFVWHVVVSGDTCPLLEEVYGVTLAQLVFWNPNLAADCSNLLLGEAYCVAGRTPNMTATGTATTGSAPATSTASTATSASPSTPLGVSTTISIPGPTQSGITSGCTAYYLVVAGDSCSSIESQFGISFAQFYAWNPAIGSNCAALWVGEAYCVAGPALASATTVTPPAPTQSGIAANCAMYTVAGSGASCAAIEAQYNITFAQFYAWNPAIGSGCTALWVGEAYCVRVS